MRVATTEMRHLGRSLFTKAGASPASATTVVNHLMEADAMGLRSHGTMRILQYLAEIEAGTLDPRGVPRVVVGKPGRASVHGGDTFGQVVGARMAQTAIELARETGIALVNGRRMGHTGRIGAYPEAIADAGLLGFAVCSGAPSGHWVAPFGGREGRLATNPIAFAYPTAGAHPVVADFSTAAAPEGVIRNLRARGAAAPVGWLRDAEGRTATDPSVLYEERRGAIQPFGGDQGYRGTALAVLVEVLATLLVNEAVDDPTRTGSDMALVAIEPDSDFPELAHGLGEYIRGATPVDPAVPVMMPGDRERAARQSAAPWMDIDDSTREALDSAASRYGVRRLSGFEE